MTKRTHAQRAAALSVALSLSAFPALAAGPVPPGFIWIGQAASGAGVGGAAAPETAMGVGNANGTGATSSSTTGSSTTGSSTTGTDTGTAASNGGSGANGANGTNGNGVGSSQGGTNVASSTGTGGGQGSIPLPGTSGASQLFDLAATIRAALQSSADVQIATRNIEIDRKRSDEASAAGRPSVDASGTAIRYDRPTSIALGSGPPITVTPNHQEILTLNVSNRFDLTGQIRAAADQAHLQSLADEFILGQIRNARILRAQTIYFNTLRAQHQVDVAQAVLNNAERQLQDATNLNAAGVGQRIDVLRAQTQVATAQQNLFSTQNNFSIALTSFNDLVGHPLSAPVRLADPPGTAIRQPVTDFSSVGAPDLKAEAPLPTAPDEVAAININRALQTANTQRPEILQAQVNVRVAETGIKLSRAGLEPTFSLSAAGNYYPTPSFQFPRQRTGQLTATLNIPLYDGGATRDRIQESKLRSQNAQTSLASTRSDVALDVRQAYLNLVTSAQQIGAANAALQAAIGARQLAQLRYQGQVGLYLEITDAQAALVQAENNQVDAVYNYLVARAQFQNAVGTPQMQ